MVLLCSGVIANCASRRPEVPLAHDEIPVGESFYLPAERLSVRMPLDVDFYRPVVSIIAVGDIMLGGSALGVVSMHGADYPFDSTRSTLRRADVAIGNLEAPFTARGEPFEKKYTFRMPASCASGIRSAGFDVLNLANNHMLDYGPEGLFDTVAVLDSLGIAHCGAGQSDSLAANAALIEVGQTRVAFLGFSMTFPGEFWATSDKPGTCFATESSLRQAVRRVRPHVDHLVVSFHWGGELMTTPKPYQRHFARLAIDLGADLVLGHHAHVLQGVEVYQGRLIAYGLGNFAFGSYSKNARESMILKVYLDREGPFFAQVMPICVYNLEVAFQPRFLKGEKKQRVIETLAELSAELNGGRSIIDREGNICISAPDTTRTTPPQITSQP